MHDQLLIYSTQWKPNTCLETGRCHGSQTSVKCRTGYTMDLAAPYTSGPQCCKFSEHHAAHGQDPGGPGRPQKRSQLKPYPNDTVQPPTPQNCTRHEP